MRTDLYQLVHKAQRYHLFAFAQQLAHANLEDAATRGVIEGKVRQLGALLRDHAENEHRYIHPLFAAIGPAAVPLESEHLVLEDEIAAWVALIDQQRWGDLYRTSMCLIGRYLLHLDAEERAQAQHLWPHYSDRQLGEVLARFKAERTPRAARVDLELFITGLGTHDLVDFLQNFSAAPSTVRRDVFDLTRQLLGVERWAEIVGRLPAIA